MTSKLTIFESGLVLEERVEKGHVQFRLKCLACGLHFTVYSYYTDWLKKVGVAGCPECYERASMLLKMVKDPQQIYELVPGEQDDHQENQNE